MTDTISAFLGAQVIQEEKKEISTEVVQTNINELEVANKNAKFDEASEYVNTNLKELIDMSMESLPNMFRVMGESEDPKFYQVTSVFLKTIADINKTYYEVNKPNGGVTGKKGVAGSDGEPTVGGSGGQTIQINNSQVQLVNTSDLLD